MIIKKIDNKDIALLITEDNYNANKESIDKAIETSLDNNETSGKVNYSVLRVPTTAIWELLKTKEEMLEELDRIIDVLYTKCNNEQDHSKSSSISRVIDSLKHTKEEIEERL
ncbi:hypothetical protein [Aliarcobacter butzleri]|uniref:hypothetical protein n=1 Tax=Aliarcobacter butzleri TaxID=28197 RepID=UPI001269DD1F|nr:hypothetical protein [Aliarcobacter butzleri]